MSHSLRGRAAASPTVAIVILAGCKKSYDESCEYEQVQTNQKQGIEALIAQGAKTEKLNHGLGDAWSIHMPGKPITEETITYLKQVDKVDQLNLSGSTVTDAQILAMYEKGIFNSLVGIDLSKTAVTDAILNKLSEVQFLGHLDVTGTKVTSNGLAQFKQARAKNERIPKITKSPKIIGP